MNERSPDDIRPVVAKQGTSSIGLYAFMGVLGIGGLMLFSALNSARTDEVDELEGARIAQGGVIASPPPLAVPARFGGDEPPEQRRLPVRLFARAPSGGFDNAPTSSYAPPTFVPPPPPPEIPPAPPRTYPDPPAEVVYEEGADEFTGSSRQPRNDNPRNRSERVLASRFENPGYTIPQGTVIPAVLETALDSTRPGGVRALVQRDVMSFDGTRVLIPRGSRLYGEYEAGLQRGQNRALVQWGRLIRPDGVTIALDSPSSDPLGRAGIKGKVDGKFWQRFGGALLNSVFDVGVGLAVRQASNGVVLALPSSTQNVEVAPTDQIQPTLKVKHGTSVSVFVSRDLDFSSVQ